MSCCWDPVGTSFSLGWALVGLGGHNHLAERRATTVLTRLVVLMRLLVEVVVIVTRIGIGIGSFIVPLSLFLLPLVTCC